jgi:hypothetical protein
LAQSDAVMTTATSTPLRAFEAIKSKKYGPIKKFELIKTFGSALRESGISDPAVLSCAELEQKIAAIIHRMN